MSGKSGHGPSTSSNCVILKKSLKICLSASTYSSVVKKPPSLSPSGLPGTKSPKGPKTLGKSDVATNLSEPTALILSPYGFPSLSLASSTVFSNFPAKQE